MTCSRWLAVAVVAAGCAGKPVAAPVDPARARQALTATLDAWKAGRPIESLAQDSPPVVAQDFDWMARAKLDGYEVLDAGTPQDANLRVGVRLKLAGKPAKTVYYVVGTDKTLTVFRAFE